jgi:hypothetical protein
MSSRPDIAVCSPDDQLQLTVEVKAVSETDAAWAAQYRRNLLDQHLIPHSPYFLLVAGDNMYLWSNRQDEKPIIQVSTKAALARYLPVRSISLSGTGLEMAVQWWLNELIAFPRTERYGSEEKRLLETTGLLSSIRAGSLSSEVLQ